MAVNNTLPVSAIIKSQNDDEPKKKSREDWRKAKELEEARKLGTAPAAVDEEGKDINPHIPQYISQAPWYFGLAGQATLTHQRPQEEKQEQFSTLDEWYKRGTQVDTAATRYRKGACENCGALTHKKKDCLDRPRKIGAKFSGDDIKPDESCQPKLKFDYDGKRDRWNGYDPNSHKAIIEEFTRVEEAKRQLKAQKLIEDAETPVAETAKKPTEGDSDEEDDEDKYADDFDMPGTKVDSKQRITVRNLRIREDTAKYLRNLDINSAYYDPKTRSMRENPYKGTGKSEEEVHFAGENFVRYTGDTTKHARAQLFAWDAYNKGVDVHALAEPTKLELLKGEFEEKKNDFKQTVKSNILDKYGGVDHLQMPPRELIFAQTEDYVEYSRHGKIIKGEERPIIRSKYEEDVFPSNHTSVWGSYWKNGSWGFKCCHSFLISSYCTGAAGRDANEGDSALVNLAEKTENAEHVEDVEKEEAEEEEEDEEKTLVEVHQKQLRVKKQKKREKKKLKKLRKKERKLKKKLAKSDSSSSDSEDNDDEDEIDPKKLKKALAAEEKSKKAADILLKTEERKRSYNSMLEVKEPSKEEMEAYFIKRSRPEDPMSQFNGD